MNILTTGGTGYVGGHITEYLTRVGHHVENLNREDFENKSFSILNQFDGRVDVVIHCAWPRINDIQSLEHIAFANKSIEFLSTCRDMGLKVINIGSHAEYGVQEAPASELDRCEPVTTYGIAKLATTLYAKKLGHNTLRLFAVYGDGGRTFKDIVDRENAKFNQPDNVKDFIPIGMVEMAIERLINMPHLFGEIINVCSGTQESARELALKQVDPNDTLEQEKIMQKFYQYPQRQYEPSEWRGNPDKMIKLLNIRP